MSKGVINTLVPPGNTGMQNGAGMINKMDSSGNLMGPPYYVFQTPQGVESSSRGKLAEGTEVNFTEGHGYTASQIEVAQVPLGILNFQASRNGDGTHYLYWQTQGASKATIMPGIIDVSNKLPDGSLTITNPTASTYTLTISDSAGNENSASDSV